MLNTQKKIHTNKLNRNLESTLVVVEKTAHALSLRGKKEGRAEMKRASYQFLMLGL